jgi:hypothetical protein
VSGKVEPSCCAARSGHGPGGPGGGRCGFELAVLDPDIDTTYNRNLATISSLFTWCVDNDLVARSPSRGLRRRQARVSIEAERQSRQIPTLRHHHRQRRLNGAGLGQPVLERRPDSDLFCHTEREGFSGPAPQPAAQSPMPWPRGRGRRHQAGQPQPGPGLVAASEAVQAQRRCHPQNRSGLVRCSASHHSVVDNRSAKYVHPDPRAWSISISPRDPCITTLTQRRSSMRADGHSWHLVTWRKRAASSTGGGGGPVCFPDLRS